MKSGFYKKGLLLLKNLKNFVIFYPSSGALSFFYNFGFLAFMCLALQIISGIFLAMHYVPHVDFAFTCIEHISRDVNYGWLVRYLHSNGASVFFIVVYLHILRGLYYNSYLYPRQLVWIIGVFILVAMILTAFLGYVLPWGQMSYWGATVITNLLSVVPKVGKVLVHWLWGGFSVNQATLNRFFSFHYLLPFIIIILAFLHLLFLHETGASNPLGIQLALDDLSLYPYYIVKDLFGLNVLAIIFLIFVFFIPNYLGHPDNYILANPLSTPPHIVPEWYFLPFYAILRSIPNKTLGVFFFVAAIFILAFLPFIFWFSKVRSFSFRPFHQVFFFIFVFIALLLGWIGSCPVVSPLYEIGQVATFIYFFIYIFFFLFTVFEYFIYKIYLKMYYYNVFLCTY